MCNFFRKKKKSEPKPDSESKNYEIRMVINENLSDVTVHTSKELEEILKLYPDFQFTFPTDEYVIAILPYKKEKKEK